MIHFLVGQEGAFGIRDYLGLWGKGLADRLRVVYYEDLPGVSRVPSGVWVFAELDQLLPAGMRLARELAEQLLAAGAGVRVLNVPDRTLLRFELLEELYRRGLNRHRVTRATGAARALRFPVFLRRESGHEGALTPLLHAVPALEAALGAELLRGHRRDELLVVEFQDTADGAGYYRKYAAFVVGPEIIPRSLAYGREWMLKHAETEFSAELFREEEAFVRGNPHEAELRRIAAVAQVEYGRIDYAVRDGVVTTWEINLNPTIGRGSRQGSGSIPEALRPLRQGTREHFYRRLEAAFRMIDAEGAPREIPITLTPVAPTGVTRLRQPRSTRGQVYQMLGPLQPLFGRLRETLAPLVGRAALRERRRLD